MTGSVSGLAGLWPFRFVIVSVVSISQCGRHDLVAFLNTYNGGALVLIWVQYILITYSRKFLGVIQRPPEGWSLLVHIHIKIYRYPRLHMDELWIKFIMGLWAFKIIALWVVIIVLWNLIDESSNLFTHNAILDYYNRIMNIHNVDMDNLDYGYPQLMWIMEPYYRWLL